MKILKLVVMQAFLILLFCNSSQYLAQDHVSAESYLNEFFAETADCLLPCVMGLNVGSKIDKEVISILDDIKSLEDKNYLSYFMATQPQGNFSAAVYLRSKKIQSLILDLSSPEQWLSSNPFTFDKVIDQLHTPDEVYILFSGPPAGYTLLLVYENERIIFQYRFEVNTPEIFEADTPIPFCTIESSVTQLIRLSITVQDSTYDQWRLNVVPGLFDERQTRPWKRLSDLTEFNRVSLFDNLSSDTECVDLTTFGMLRNSGYQF